MAFDQWVLYLHILAAITWMGAGITLVLLSFRAKQKGNELRVIGQMEWLGPRIGGPSVIIMVSTGVWMVARSGAWKFSQGWIIGGLVLLVFLFLVGVGFHVPQYKRIQAAVDEDGVRFTESSTSHRTVLRRSLG